MTTMSKPIIIGAAVPALLLMGAGCGESEKKCSQITSKAQCGKGCQWKPNNATSSCKQNYTMLNQFFNFSEASDFFYQKDEKGNPKTVHDLKKELKELRAKLDVESKDHNDHLDDIEWKEWLIEQKTAGGHDLSKSEEVFKRCKQANGIWRRQLEDAQTNRTAVYPIQYQEFVDEFKNMYDGQELSFKVHLHETAAVPRNYLRTNGTATLNTTTLKITLAGGKDDNGKKIKHEIANEEDFNRLGVVLNDMSLKCHQRGGLVSQSRAGDIACVTLPEYLKREDHADSIDDQHHCEEANKRAQKALYLEAQSKDANVDAKKKHYDPPTLFKWEDKCVVAQPCEFIWKNIDGNITASVDKDHRYCKAKLDRKTEDTNVQCTFDIPRLGNECVVDNKRKICGYYGTQSPHELHLGAGICQLVNSDAADSPGRCSDVVKKAPEKENKSSSDSDKQKKEDKGRI